MKRSPESATIKYYSLPPAQQEQTVKPHDIDIKANGNSLFP